MAIIISTSKPYQTAAQVRKIKKPMIERKRRDRINESLNQLKTLVLEAMNKDESRYTKMEKADILEMTVSYLQSRCQSKRNARPVNTPTTGALMHSSLMTSHAYRPHRHHRMIQTSILVKPLPTTRLTPPTEYSHNTTSGQPLRYHVEDSVRLQSPCNSAVSSSSKSVNEPVTSSLPVNDVIVSAFTSDEFNSETSKITWRPW